MNYKEMLEVLNDFFGEDVLPERLVKKYSSKFNPDNPSAVVRQVFENPRSAIKYYLMDDGRTVYATMKVHPLELLADLRSSTFDGITYTNYLKMKPMYSGKAICREGDNFDLEYGKKLARTRMLKKYYRDRLRKSRMFLDNMKKSYFTDAMKANYHAFHRLKELDSDLRELDSSLEKSKKLTELDGQIFDFG